MAIICTVVQVTILNFADFSSELGENEAVTPDLCLERDGLSDVDVSVQITTRGRSATSKLMELNTSSPPSSPSGLCTSFRYQIVTYCISPLFFLHLDNVDFVIDSRNVSIPASRIQRVQKCGSISLTILDDLIVEGNETMALFLESADPSRISVLNGNLLESRTLTIIDDDSEYNNIIVYNYWVRPYSSHAY